jgi:hypothetical protein
VGRAEAGVKPEDRVQLCEQIIGELNKFFV